MSEPSELTNSNSLEEKFYQKFNGSAGINFLGDPTYSIKLNPKNNNNYEYQEYLLFPLTGGDVKKLMEESLKIGKDLVLQECKYREYNEDEAEDKQYIEKVLEREKRLKGNI